MGKIEIITGSMYAGKTDELIRRIKRTAYAKQFCVAFKHNLDDRFSVEDIVSHDKYKIKCVRIANSKELLNFLNSDKKLKKIDVIAIDEAQFFDDGIIDMANKLANNNKRVIIAGLDMDSNGAPFGPMPSLMAIADEVTKLKAVCSTCGDDAMYSKRIVNISDTILVGEINSYIAVCRKHLKD